MRAAIDKLKHKLEIYEAVQESPSVCEEFRQAIAILEAAGKVDKNRGLAVLATLLQSYVLGRTTILSLEKDLEDGAIKEIRALLESLPEKP